ncbi:cupin domain-containing protein [Candidatus Latescibacterota bacterium]
MKNFRKIKWVPLIFVCAGFLFSSALVFAQGESVEPYSRLDPKPYDPEVDADIDLFIGSWKESVPVTVHGAIVERTILTPCADDPLKPEKKGAVLNYLSAVSYGSLPGKAYTQPSSLKGVQEIYYIVSGSGIITAGDKDVVLRTGIFILVPEGLTFTMKNTLDEPLLMYIVREAVPDGFRPNGELLVVDEDTLRMGSRAHWSHLAKRIFMTEDGLGTLQSMYIVYFNPMTMGQPHSHVEGSEEIWITLEGDNVLLLGKELRDLPPGSGFKIPPDGITPHSSINTSDKPVKMICFARYGDHEVRK